MKNRETLLLILLMGCVPLFALSAAPKVDGVIGASEYAQTQTDNGVVIESTFTPDRIYLAVSAPGDGWVAIGLGTSVMNGATIFMGYIDSNGSPQFTVQKGRFHTHSDFSGETPIGHAVAEADGTTTLELEVNRADFVPSGTRTLDIIYAYNRSAKDFRTRHSFRNAGTLTVE